MERIWRIFTAGITTFFAIGLLLFSLSLCFWAGRVLTNIVNWSLGGIGLNLRIPLTIMFSIAAGYIFLSLVLGHEGYFDRDSDRTIHRGARLGDANSIRGKLSNLQPSDQEDNSSVRSALNKFEHDSKVGELLLELLNPLAWIPSKLFFWRKPNRKPVKKPGGLK